MTPKGNNLFQCSLHYATSWTPQGWKRPLKASSPAPLQWTGTPQLEQVVQVSVQPPLESLPITANSSGRYHFSHCLFVNYQPINQTS